MKSNQDEAKNLGKRIRFYRKKAGLTQSALAAIIQRGANTIPRWERGEILPKAQNIPLLAKALGITSSELLDENVENEKNSAEVKATGKKNAKNWQDLNYWGDIANELTQLMNSKDSQKIVAVKAMLETTLKNKKTKTKSTSKTKSKKQEGKN